MYAGRQGSHKRGDGRRAGVEEGTGKTCENVTEKPTTAEDSYKHTYKRHLFTGYYPRTAEVAGTMPFLDTWAIQKRNPVPGTKDLTSNCWSALFHRCPFP